MDSTDANMAALAAAVESEKQRTGSIVPSVAEPPTEVKFDDGCQDIFTAEEQRKLNGIKVEMFCVF